MPRQQTYGKRSRLIYDPRAAPAPFSSPDHQTSTGTRQAESERNKKRENLNGGEEPRESKCHGGRTANRRALGERSSNEVPSPGRPTSASRAPRRPRHTRKVVLDEEDEVENREPRGNQLCGDRATHDLQDSIETTGKRIDQGLPLVTVQIKRQKPELSVRNEEKARSHKHLPTPEGSALSSSSSSLKTSRLAPATPTSSEDEATRDQPTTSSSNSSSKCQDGQLSPLSPQLPAQIQQPPIDLTDPHQSHSAALLAQSSHPLSSFEAWSDELSAHFSISKIAEASFGEVYRLTLAAPNDSNINDSGNNNNNNNPLARADESVIKLIALTPPPATLPTDKRRRNAQLRRAEAMSAPGAVATEVQLLQRMSAIPGFTRFRDVRVLQGRPGGAFVRAFRAFERAQRRRGKDGSAFPDPGRPASYGAGQLWAAVEMQDAGTDLERMVEAGACARVRVVWDVFWQVVLALAKGEEAARFEHRDLHLGNICVRERAETGRERERRGGLVGSRKLHFTRLETTIIDYTLSRATMLEGSVAEAGEQRAAGDDADAVVAYHDLAADPAVFEGDATDEYQYEIYRYMRAALFLDRPLAQYSESTPAATARSWRQYHPQTNLVWLHLVLAKLLEQVCWPSAEQQAQEALKGRGITEHRDNEVSLQDAAFEDALRQTAVLLEPANLGSEDGIASAGDLVHVAIAEGWIDVEDVVGEDVVEDEDEIVVKLRELDL